MTGVTRRSAAQPRLAPGLLCASLFAVAAAGCGESALTPMGSAALVLSEIRVRGPAPVAKRMDSDAKFARSVLDGIATGDSAWLEVAKVLEPSSSAVDASLAIALAAALPLAPARVLSILGDNHSADEICGIPFPRATPARITGYRDSTLAALAAMDRADVTKSKTGAPARLPAAGTGSKAERDACTLALRQAADRKLARIDPSYIVKNKPVIPRKAPPRKRARRTPRRT